MVAAPELACPVVVRISSAHGYASEELIDAMAHDMHCTGYESDPCQAVQQHIASAVDVLLYCLTGIRFVSADGSVGSSAEAV